MIFQLRVVLVLKITNYTVTKQKWQWNVTILAFSISGHVSRSSERSSRRPPVNGRFATPALNGDSQLYHGTLYPYLPVYAKLHHTFGTLSFSYFLIRKCQIYFLFFWFSFCQKSFICVFLLSQLLAMFWESDSRKKLKHKYDIATIYEYNNDVLIYQHQWPQKASTFNNWTINNIQIDTSTVIIWMINIFSNKYVHCDVYDTQESIEPSSACVSIGGVLSAPGAYVHI